MTPLASQIHMAECGLTFLVKPYVSAKWFRKVDFDPVLKLDIPSEMLNGNFVSGYLNASSREIFCSANILKPCTSSWSTWTGLDLVIFFFNTVCILIFGILSYIEIVPFIKRSSINWWNDTSPTCTLERRSEITLASISFPVEIDRAGPWKNWNWNVPCAVLFSLLAFSACFRIPKGVDSRWLEEVFNLLLHFSSNVSCA